MQRMPVTRYVRLSRLYARCARGVSALTPSRPWYSCEYQELERVPRSCSGPRPATGSKIYT